jgi:hypothetical protein
MSNIKREQFNTMLRDTYRGKPVFDLAAFESTYPDGSRESSVHDGRECYAMVPLYATEGGDHLNAFGRKLAARRLLHVLAEAIR